MNTKYKIGIATALLIVALGGSAYGGYYFGNKRSVVVTDSKQLINGDFNLFWEAVDIVKGKHVDGSGSDENKLVYGAIKGMLSAYDDPYTAFFNPADAKKFNEDLSGNFGGIGAQIGMRNEQLLVIAPLKGTPAEKAGLRPLDKIWKIDDKDTSGLLVEEAIKLIRGKEGTTVKLSIYREGWKNSKDFSITRGIIQVPTLDLSMKTLKSGKKVAVISLYNFNSNVPGIFKNAALEAISSGAEGIVFDLRNNPGGFLDVATNLSGWFMKKGSVVVIEKNRSGNDEKLFADGNAALSNLPVVVVVNGGSASASEIVAGALHDNVGAKIIGEKTFGKGSVQEVDTMSDGSTLKVTIAHWFTPNGTIINKVGLKPDIEVALTDADVEKGIDTQMDKALKVIDSEILAKKQ
ncbi:MAG: S41 family peptidase [bacterium]